jgi:hypothetical protein
MNTYEYKLAAEIGVQRGEFSKVILNGWNGHLFLIDSWQKLENYEDIANVSNESQSFNLEQTKINVSQHTERYTIIKDLSHAASKLFQDQSLDLVYLDADHSYNGVIQDLTCWLPKVRMGGMICGHDYLDGNLPEGIFGVKSAVLDFFKKEPDFITEELWPSWFIKIEQLYDK